MSVDCDTSCGRKENSLENYTQYFSLVTQFSETLL